MASRSPARPQRSKTQPSKSQRPKAGPSDRTRVLLVRHGQTPTTGKTLPGRAPGLHLSDTGRSQADAAAERIRGIDKIAAVYASPLERTRETAAPISRSLGLRTKTERGLIECDFGEWTGRELSELVKLPEWTTVQKAPSMFRFPAGESFVEMQTRMVSTVERLCRQHRGETIVCVSHADPIKALVAHALGTHIDLFQRIVISTCSVTVFQYTPSGPIVLAVNSTGGSLKELVPS